MQALGCGTMRHRTAVPHRRARQHTGDVLLSLRSVDRGSATVELPLAIFGSAQEARAFFDAEFGSLPHCFPVIRSHAPVRADG